MREGIHANPVGQIFQAQGQQGEKWSATHMRGDRAAKLIYSLAIPVEGELLHFMRCNFIFKLIFPPVG